MGGVGALAKADAKPYLSPGSGTMSIENGTFTALDFRLRAEARAMPLAWEDGAGEAGAVLRGDHHPDGGPVLDSLMASLRLAAVLVPVIDRGGEATVLLTLRAAHLPSHAGQIAFPGGKVAEEDADAVATALREAEEEIGLKPDFVHPIARLDAYHTNSGFRVIPVLSVVSPSFTLALDEREVTDVFEVPLRFLMTAANHQRHSLTWQGQERQFYAMPFENRYIWGATAGILRILYERLYSE